MTEQKETQAEEQAAKGSSDEAAARFLASLPAGAKVAVLGCGEGDRARAFRLAGFDVAAQESDRAKAEKAEKALGIRVERCEAKDFEPAWPADGIWAGDAFSSLPLPALEETLSRLSGKLSNNGCLFLSFRRGDADSIAGGRFSLAMNEARLEGLLEKIPTLRVADASDEDSPRFEVTLRRTDPKTRAVLSLLGYASELAKIRERTVTKVENYKWHKFLDEIDPELPGVTLWSPEDGDSQVLLSVEQQDIPACPVPDYEIFEWLPAGWDKPGWEEAYYATQPGWEGAKSEAPRFEDSPKRKPLWEAWLAKRDLWLEQVKKAQASLKLFEALYMKGREIEDSGLELMAAAGSVSFASSDEKGGFRVPILVQPVRFETVAKGRRTIVRVVVDEAETPRFQSRVFSEFTDEGFSQQACRKVSDAVSDKLPHPFDLGAARKDFQELAGLLCPPRVRWADRYKDCRFSESVPFWFYERPVIWIQQRPADLSEAADEIMKLIEKGETIPAPLADLAFGPEGGKAKAEEKGAEELADRLAAVGGESETILLSKESNREQLQIAEDIENHSAVLVQGPPGTGKTHTISNLVGHFLAQGKRILVTSQKANALTVLKEKLPEPIQTLCVTYVEGNGDAERTVSEMIERLGQVRTGELKERIEAEKAGRHETIRLLREGRLALYAKIHEEEETVEVPGGKMSWSALGRWLKEREKQGSRIPTGESKAGIAFPLSDAEVAELYGACAKLSGSAASELAAVQPEAADVPEAEALLSARQREAEVKAERDALGIEVSEIREMGVLTGYRLKGPKGELEVLSGAYERLPDFLSQIEEAASLADDSSSAWQKAARLAPAAGGAKLPLWRQLEELLKKAAELSVKCETDSVMHPVEIEAGANRTEIAEALRFFRDNSYTGEPGFWLKLTQGSKIDAIAKTKVSGRVPSSIEDYGRVIDAIELEETRSMLGRAWDALMKDECAFSAFGEAWPEQAASRKYGRAISEALGWWEKAAKPFAEGLKQAGVRAKFLAMQPAADPEGYIAAMAKESAEVLLPAADYAKKDLFLREAEESAKALEAKLSEFAGKGSGISKALLAALSSGDAGAYGKAREELASLSGLGGLAARRDELLGRLAAACPKWAAALRAGKDLGEAPKGLADAWLWQQREAFFRKYEAAKPDDLQAKTAALSKQLREQTGALASDLAWLRLAQRMEENPAMVHALKAWSLVVKRIGKGTGKLARVNQRKAQELMEGCQGAVPVWIMPIDRALRTFRGKDRFDVLIIDEASQSDVTALPVFYLADKAIISGDDRQVSPSAVGVESQAAESLQQRFLKGKVANYQIYQPQTSVYDIAATAYQPLMLREHFRCVPDIINFCNRLSYDGKILPLRSGAKTTLAPAVVPLRVEGGVREGDTNRGEAEEIAAVIASCIREPEYKGKTFGVISMLSGKSGSASQVNAVKKAVYEAIGPQQMQERRVLCGTSAEFQGDERDVIFLSLVDSQPEGSGAIRTQTAGADDMMKKRWNVAVSRAKDQLWAVHSFDPSKALSASDLRRSLFDYIDALEDAAKAPAKKAGTALEQLVADALRAKGFRIDLQHEIGSFTLDMVATSGRKRAAIECDGEEPEDLAAVMERQAILERCGWKFLRLRGGEYFRDPEAAVERLAGMLRAEGIFPESEAGEAAAGKTLLERVLEGKGRAPEPEVPEAEEAPAPAAKEEPEESRAPQDEKPEPEEEKAQAADEAPAPAPEKKPAPRRRAAAKKPAAAAAAVPEEAAEAASPKPRARKPKAAAAAQAAAFDEAAWEAFANEKELILLDKRPKGHLWVIGGDELRPVMEEAWTRLRMNFLQGKGKPAAANGQKAWWFAGTAREEE